MEVRHQLPAFLAAVYYQPVSAFGDTFTFSQLIGGIYHMSHQGHFGFRYIKKGRNVLSGDDKDMRRGKGTDITEGK